MRRFYAKPEQFNESTVTLSPEESHHLSEVLRLKIADHVQVFDGNGLEFLCEIVGVGKHGARLQIIRSVEPSAPEPNLELILAVGAYKNDKLDLVVQKAVELGVVRVIPVITLRSEVKPRDTVRRTERWKKIALEATKQCERALVMSVDEPLEFQQFITGIDESYGSLWMFSEKDGGGIPAGGDHKKVTALVGPKGGWEDSEIELAVGRGFLPIKLGRRIMKAETAAITFAALLQHRFGDLN